MAGPSGDMSLMCRKRALLATVLGSALLSLASQAVAADAAKATAMPCSAGAFAVVEDGAAEPGDDIDLAGLVATAAAGRP